MTDKDLV